MNDYRKKLSGSLFKGTIFCAFLIILISNLIAGEVDSLTARKAALNFITPRLTNQSSLKSQRLGYPILNLSHISYIEGKPIYYIFNISGSKGFVIISANDATIPVLGYSFESNFTNSETRPQGFDSLVYSYQQQIEYVRKNNLPETKREIQDWGDLTGSMNIPVEKTTTKTVAPLLSTKWNQGCGYNDLCPADAGGPCGKTWAGCVAVSMAQVLKYWNYPASGENSCSYNHYKYGSLSADYGTSNYNWASMPNNSSNAEIAKLLYHLGISVQMNYGTSGSGAYFTSTQYAITRYFKYSNNAYCTTKFGYSDINWINMLKNELDEGRPIMFAGGTHAFVIDGYDAGDYFHVNWGWGGSYDGYFYISNLKPGGSDFTSGQFATIGVIPKNLEIPVDNSEIKDLTCGISYPDSTYNGKNHINKYNNSYLAATGKEKYYTFNTSQGGRLKIKLKGLDGKNMALFLLSYPHRDSVIATGDSLLSYYALLPRKYYVSVDGINGEQGKYSIQLLCPDSRPDLSVIKARINPQMAESNQSNIMLSCFVKNFGNSASGSGKLQYWYSEDNKLDASDIKLDSCNIPGLNPQDSVYVSSIITLPAFTEGYKYIIFSVDPQNMINETDETDNMAITGFQGLPPSIMDCSTAVSLQSEKWFHGNTSTIGNSNISSYGEIRGYSGKEVIHTIVPSYNGVSTISFSKKANAFLNCMLLSACNENKLISTIGLEGKQDTITTISFRVEKNKTLYLVVDGMQGYSGEYWLRVNLPDSCPKPVITLSGDSSFCKNSTSLPYLSSSYGYSSYQWLNNGFPVIAATNYYLMPNESGKYQIEVTENNCVGHSNIINILATTIPKPIIALTGSDSLKASVVADSYNWYYNSVKNTYTSQTIKPNQSGEYKVVAIINNCQSEISDGYNFTITLNKHRTLSNFLVLPNPSNGIFYIQSDQVNFPNISIKIYNSGGNLVYTCNNNQYQTKKIDLSKQEKGIYILKIKSDQYSQTIKLLLE